MVSLEAPEFRRPTGVKQIPVGTVFGLWTTVEKVIPRVLPDKLAGQVKVVCVCGVTKYLLAGNLIAGRSLGCRTCRGGIIHGKGKDAGYGAKHERIRNLKGKASSCIWGCEASRYDWACIWGDYDDPDDYVSMCRKCHNRFDREVKRFILNTSTDLLVQDVMHLQHDQAKSAIRNIAYRERKRDAA